MDQFAHSKYVHLSKILDNPRAPDADYGLGSMPFLSLNPALNGPHGTTVNQSLNQFNPANRFVKGGSSNFTADFRKRYQAGVVKRNNDIINHKQERLAKIESGETGETGLTDDEPLYITDAAYGTMNNNFFCQNMNYIAHITYPWKMLHKGGKIINQIVQTVRVPVNFESYATSYMQGALKTTIRRFLSTFAIRAGEDFEIMPDGFKGIDFASNQFSPSESIKGGTVPLLNMGMTGHWEYLKAEKIQLNVASNDTDVAFVEGATHKIATCLECERYPGEFGHTMVIVYDYMAGWLGRKGRFL